ncbi:hypothetical protein [Halomonas cerina]|uniref:YfhG lipoprotein n=1 Tax=Halomonas cerina TaxID=447424 RepID=A0A839V9K8_9GAMM|nr:hypothetical protein [Halomonas cerina]MBB3190738.1 hypothetical protein [Halomonas cerina]
MTLRPWLAGLVLFGLAGCQWTPDSLSPSGGASRSASQAASPACVSEMPDFDDEACLLHDWVAFGLASQRGDHAWREGMLGLFEGAAAEQRLARAVLLAWGGEAQWDRASVLLKADLHAAPPALQPLLRYWLNEVEGRRALAGRLAESRRALATLKTDNKALAEKLDALTDIERNINLRQQTE